MFAAALRPHVKFQAFNWERICTTASALPFPLMKWPVSITDMHLPSKHFPRKWLLVAGIISYSKFLRQIECNPILGLSRPAGPSLSNNLQRFDPLAQAIEIPFLDPLWKVLESLGRMSKAAGRWQCKRDRHPRWLTAAGIRLWRRCNFLHELTCASIRRLRHVRSWSDDATGFQSPQP